MILEAELYVQLLRLLPNIRYEQLLLSPSHPWVVTFCAELCGTVISTPWILRPSNRGPRPFDLLVLCFKPVLSYKGGVKCASKRLLLFLADGAM